MKITLSTRSDVNLQQVGSATFFYLKVTIFPLETLTILWEDTLSLNLYTTYDGSVVYQLDQAKLHFPEFFWLGWAEPEGGSEAAALCVLAPCHLSIRSPH